MKQLFLAFALLFSAHLARSAQNHQQMQDGATIPVGAVSGDRIPDMVAYRLYFTHLSQLPEKLQAEQVRYVGLSAADAAILTKSLDEFGGKYLALTEAYNAEATVANTNGRLPNISAYHSAVAKLVDETTRGLFASLSSPGVGKFVTKVKSEKANMVISESEAGQ